MPLIWTGHEICLFVTHSDHTMITFLLDGDHILIFLAQAMGVSIRSFASDQDAQDKPESPGVTD